MQKKVFIKVGIWVFIVATLAVIYLLFLDKTLFKSKSLEDPAFQDGSSVNFNYSVFAKILNLKDRTFKFDLKNTHKNNPFIYN